ncbi:unnamed protein product [Rangifer tarandus platyrhynchus]|uniref:Protein FAM229A n=1 Tax=Rangifer tarandus platyrhynchus TaxID=3082113 RepID=A0ABN8Z058_RANTA|nr:unnamed protein product [Rangifer tarandus platyrhynchus]
MSALGPGCQALFRGRPHRAAGGLRDPWPQPSSSWLAAALSAQAAWGFPARGTSSVRSARRDPGHNAALPLDVRARTRRRHLPGSAWTGASSRGLGLRLRQGRRFPIEAGDSPGLAAAPESQDSPEPVATEHNPVRPLRRCPGCHCLTLLHVPIDVYLAMGGSPRARAT